MAQKLSFTKSSLESIPLPATGKRTWVYDLKTPSLALCITSSGSRSFYIYRRVEGKPEQIRLGGYPEMTIEQARRRAAEINGEIAKGTNPNEIKRGKRTEWTFAHLFTDYLEQAKRRKKSWPGDEAQYRRYLQAWQHKKLSGIQKTAVKALHDRIGTEHGIYAANRLLALIRAVFNYGIRERDLPLANPAIGIRMFPEVKRDRRLHGFELPCFFEAVGAEWNPDIRDYVLMSLLTGVRKSNLLAMRWDELHYDRQVWEVPETKNGSAMTVPLVAPAIKILKERQSLVQGPFVFPGSGQTGHLAEPKKGWARILQRARVYGLIELIGAHEKWTLEERNQRRDQIDNLTEALAFYGTEAKRLRLDTNSVALKNLRPHDLRRTLASWQVDTGASLAVVGKTLGHKSPAATAIYARLSVDPVRDAMEKATSAMLTHTLPVRPADKNQLDEPAT